jgi:hypothetical protein
MDNSHGKGHPPIGRRRDEKCQKKGEGGRRRRKTGKRKNGDERAGPEGVDAVREEGVE